VSGSSFERKLDAILARKDELEALLAVAAPSAYAALAREHAELEPVAAEITAWRKAKHELAELEQLQADPEMRALALTEHAELRARLPALERALRLALLPKDAADDKSAILELRAGTGGEEAALFAAELLRMYQRYAQLKGWRVELLSLSETDLGGVKEATAAIEGCLLYTSPSPRDRG
jgi:peptide chain release factor 1